MYKFKLIKRSNPSNKYLHYYIEVDGINALSCCADSDEQATAWYNFYKENYKPSTIEYLLKKSVDGNKVEVTEHWKLDCSPYNLVMVEVFSAYCWVGNSIIKSIRREGWKYTQEQLDTVISAYNEVNEIIIQNSETVLLED
jgi:hypothetical protein